MTSPASEKAAYYEGIPMAPYDLLKEFAIAAVVVLVVVVILAATLSSPDVAPVTVATWAQSDPVDFVTTAAAELAGTSDSAQYGPPYNNASGSVQSLWFLQLQSWAGLRYRVDAAQEFVLGPLDQAQPGDSALSAALSQYRQATPGQQAKWLDAYSSALASATTSDGEVAVTSGDYGPLPVLMKSLLQLARTGALDGLLTASNRFYLTDYTRPLLFLSDGSYLSNLAEQQKLTGSQWGMMNETGRYPGQAWLWLYTMWYQIKPFSAAHGILGINAANADLAIAVIMAILSGLLLFVPWIPGLRDIPRWIPVHRLIWKRYYAERRHAGPESPAGTLADS